jgi:mRNA interferase RelE/StbE
MRDVVYSRDALRAFQRMPVNTSRTIRTKIEQYASNPRSLANNVKKLRGRSGYRLRIGDWRVIFEQDAEVVSILAVGPRGGMYED